jgi:NlpC/P60 family putative phage cell wall peptidase
MRQETVGDRAVAEARRWIGTPYCHQASVCGVGCDCLGFVRGVWRAVCGAEPEDLPAYTPDWGEVATSEHVLDAARRHLLPVAQAGALPGDVLVFRWRRSVVAKHLGILAAPGRLIHAWERAGVVEVALARGWSARLAAVFRFPDNPQA